LGWHLRILFVIVCLLTVASCSESADLKADATFREDFSSERLSTFRWGFPEFSLFKFKADPEMVSNSDGINYLKLGRSDSDMYSLRIYLCEGAFFIWFILCKDESL